MDGMDWIELELVGDKIAITLRREVGHRAKVRQISAADALAMSLLLLGEPATTAVNFEGSSGVTLQIMNWPYNEAWLGIDGRYGGGKLVACLEGRLIRKIGKCLHRLYNAAQKASPRRRPARAFPIDQCYLDE